jgi:DNA repair photolyase
MPIAEPQMKHSPITPATWTAPYFVGLGRAMVSLGPISNGSYCPYRCRFCYVQGPFPKYASATVEEITTWLAERRDQYDIIYISGDTDSFAQPRTNEGLNLLQALQSLNVDVLFTTRHVFGEAELERLGDISSQYRAMGLLLIGCISISQLHHPQLEPPPIKSPYLRVQLLREMQRLGIITALTIRPFIPTIPASEYSEIALLGGDFADVVLGGDLYLDSNGSVEEGIKTASENLDLNASPSQVHALDFSLNEDDWMTLTHPEAAVHVRVACETLGKPFFMRSAGAISWIRERRSTFTKSK